MKNIIIGIILLAGFYVSAQEAGKAGELLKNEASVSELGSSDSKARLQNNNNDKNRSNNNNTGLRNQTTV